LSSQQHFWPLQGSLISSVLIFLVLFVGYVWEQVRLYWNTRQVELRWEQEQQQRPPAPQVTCASLHFMLHKVLPHAHV